MKFTKKLFATFVMVAVLVASSIAPVAVTAEDTNWYDDYILFPYCPGCEWRCYYELDYYIDGVYQDTYYGYAYFEQYIDSLYFSINSLIPMGWVNMWYETQYRYVAVNEHFVSEYHNEGQIEGVVFDGRSSLSCVFVNTTEVSWEDCPSYETNSLYLEDPGEYKLFEESYNNLAILHATFLSTIGQNEMF